MVDSTAGIIYQRPRVLAECTAARTMIGCYHETVVCMSVCLSVCDAVHCGAYRIGVRG